MTIQARPSPCPSCPYRRDVPPGVWAASEYDKLPAYDLDIADGQPIGAFHCHSTPDQLCSGWLACHGPRNLLGVRMLLAFGRADPKVLDAWTDVPVFGSGREAAEHGKSGIDNPPEEATAAQEKIVRARKRRGEPLRWE